MSAETSDAPAPPAKVDPETLALRGRPPRAIRFRRGVIVVISALGVLSVVLVAWIALKPAVLRHVVSEDELAQPGSGPTSDALSALPSSYGDVPKLGPPLPGDLARPILERQRQLATEAGSPDEPPMAQARAAEQERRLAELKAARQSGVMVPNPAGAAERDAAAAAAPAMPPMPGDAGKIGFDATNDPNSQQRKADFVATLDPHGDASPHGLAQAASPYLLSTGTIIAASLITGLRSDLPGLVVAQVTEQVYDSPTGRILLIPQGARLVGNYDSVVAFGQKRALVVWRRILFPDGSSLRIDNVPASDPSGYSGLADKIDRHSWELLKGVALSTLLGVSSQLALSGRGDLVQAIRMSSQDNVSRAGDQITSRNLQAQPTISIRPGAPVRLLVDRDLILAPWKG